VLADVGTGNPAFDCGANLATFRSLQTYGDDAARSNAILFARR